MTLDGKRILLVGGTSGLGLAVARAAAERGATPIVASRRPASVEQALATLEKPAEGHTVDLTDPASIAELIERAGPIDHLVYSAGEPLRLTMLAGLTPEVVRAFWETRYVGALSVVRAAAGHLRDGGSIVLTSGNAAPRPAPGWALGASVCGAIDALTRQLALELAPIRVNAVAPGVTRSPLWSALSAEDEQAMYAGIGGGLPVGRIGEVDDVALAYLYTMEQEMATGTVVTVDGGAVLV
jgi:NAD(P)-dependent dehydrogenase (short-subunit alcohol dehydrogenase family)